MVLQHGKAMFDMVLLRGSSLGNEAMLSGEASLLIWSAELSCSQATDRSCGTDIHSFTHSFIPVLGKLSRPS